MGSYPRGGSLKASAQKGVIPVLGGVSAKVQHFIHVSSSEILTVEMGEDPASAAFPLDVSLHGFQEDLEEPDVGVRGEEACAGARDLVRGGEMDVGVGGVELGQGQSSG